MGYIISTGIATANAECSLQNGGTFPHAPYALEADQEHDGYRFTHHSQIFEVHFLPKTQKTGEILVTHLEIARFME